MTSPQAEILLHEFGERVRNRYRRRFCYFRRVYVTVRDDYRVGRWVEAEKSMAPLFFIIIAKYRYIRPQIMSGFLSESVTNSAKIVLKCSHIYDVARCCHHPVSASVESLCASVHLVHPRQRIFMSFDLPMDHTISVLARFSSPYSWNEPISCGKKQ